MIAPSGKFWMGDARESTKAPPRVTMESPESTRQRQRRRPCPRECCGLSQPAPAWWFWIRCCRGPSASSLPTCRWGIRRSSASKNKMPHQKPAAAGKNAHVPKEAERSIAGMSRLQMEAATITPAANPVSPRRRPSVRSRFKNSTPGGAKRSAGKGDQDPGETMEIQRHECSPFCAPQCGSGCAYHHQIWQDDL